MMIRQLGRLPIPLTGDWRFALLGTLRDRSHNLAQLAIIQEAPCWLQYRIEKPSRVNCAASSVPDDRCTISFDPIQNPASLRAFASRWGTASAVGERQNHCPRLHPRHNGVRPPAEHFDFRLRPKNPPRREDGNSERFAFPGDGCDTASKQLRQFLVPNPAEQAKLVIIPPFAMRNARTAPPMKVQQPVRLPQQPRDFSIRFRPDEFPDRLLLGSGLPV
jgi:hypothetical protein